EALFTRIVEDVTSYADEFVRGLRQQLGAGIDASSLEESLHELGRRLALAILRPQVIALRRLLIGEANQFPALAKEYYERAPRQVLDMLASGFEHLGRIGVLHVPDARRAAAQFAYLVAGEPLDRAVLVGVLPAKAYVIACARDGVETFLARYGTSRTRSKRTSRRRDASKREQAARRVRRRPGATSG